MKKLIITLGVIIALGSCYNVNKSDPTTPEKVIPKSELISILTDLQLVEAGFTISENRKYVQTIKPHYYNSVLESHGVTLAELRENVNYYQSTPKVMEEIYESVLENLSKIQSDVLVEIENMKLIEDSLAKLPETPVSDTAVLDKILDTIPDHLKKK